MYKILTGDVFLLDNGTIVEIIDDNYNDPFIIVKRIDNFQIYFKRNKTVLKHSISKYLGNNAKAVQILLGNSARGYDDL